MEEAQEPTTQPDDLRYELEVDRVIRGQEATTKASRHNRGWEFVSEERGVLRTSLTFRRVKPPRPPHPFAAAADALRERGEALQARMGTFSAKLGQLSSRDRRNLAWGLAGMSAVGSLALALVIAIAVVAGGSDATKKPTAAHAHRATASTPQTTATMETTSTPATKATTAAVVTDISVDDLLDRLNAQKTVAGDRFKLTGTLFQSDRWGKGATGDYAVYLKAKGGASSLMVFAKESDAKKWRNGTKVEMVVENTRATIKGDTSDGFLRATSVRTISGGTSPEAKAASARQARLSAMRAYASSANKKSGLTIIESIETGTTADIFHVNLGSVLASGTKLTAQTYVQTINKTLVDIADAKDPDDSIILYYYLAGSEVAQNRYILDPWAVKFKGILDD